LPASSVALIAHLARRAAGPGGSARLKLARINFKSDSNRLNLGLTLAAHNYLSSGFLSMSPSPEVPRWIERSVRGEI
jgi:hypothetical protein